MNPAPMLFNFWEPDPVLCGIQIDTGFSRFRTPAGLHGLAKVEGVRLELLAMAATKPDRGDFRRFIVNAKGFFDVIVVLAIWSAPLAEALTRYGFKPCEQIEEDGHKVAGMKWEKTL